MEDKKVDPDLAWVRMSIFGITFSSELFSYNEKPVKVSSSGFNKSNIEIYNYFKTINISLWIWNRIKFMILFDTLKLYNN